MNFGADLGPWRPATGDFRPKFGEYVKPSSPSRLRRKDRRAAERERSAAVNTVAAGKAAAEVVAAEKADAEATSTGKAAEEVSAFVEVAGEVSTAEKAADKLVPAENAADDTAVEKTATEVTVVEKAAGDERDAAKKAENYASVVKAAAEVASTSSCGKEQRTAETCWNCDQEMTLDHQCEVPSVTVRSRPSPSPFKCPPRTRRHGVYPPILERVKCHVCACLGRETSMVICGSTCPSCGVTATSSAT